MGYRSDGRVSEASSSLYNEVSSRTRWTGVGGVVEFVYIKRRQDGLEINLKAWRTVASSGSQPELCSEMLLPPATDAPDDLAEMIAIWPDGMRRHVPECSVKAYLAKLKPSHHENDHWTAIMPGTNNKLKVAPQKDRKMLMSLFEQNRRLCSVRIEIFGDGASAEKDAQDFMVGLAKEYLGGMDATSLRRRKDELLKARKPGVCKRPAGSGAAATPPLAKRSRRSVFFQGSEGP